MILKRIYAILIDYLVIIGYMLILSSFTFMFSSLFNLYLQINNPWLGELIGFCTLTLPVILYFVFSENSHYRGTIGKRFLGLKVVSNSSQVANFYQLVVRNSIKFLPWEMAHFFVYQLFYFMNSGSVVPSWILNGLIFSQVIAMIYLLFIIFNKQNRTVYELISDSKVVQTTQ